MIYSKKIVLLALMILSSVFTCCFAANPWKILQKTQDVSKEILAITHQDIAVPKNYGCNCEIKGDFSGKIQEITKGEQDVIIKKYYRQRGNVCDITLYSETQEGKPFESAELKMALNPLNVMIKKIAAVERLNAIAGIDLIAHFEIDKLKELYDARYEKTLIENDKVKKLTLVNRYAAAMERSFIKEWIIWTDKKNLLRKMYIEKVVRKTVEGEKEEVVVTDAEYKYSKFGRHYLPVEVIQPRENLKTVINYESKSDFYLVSAMEFFKEGAKESTMNFIYKQYENYFMPVEMVISGKERVRITCDYTKVGDYFLPGYEVFEFENLAPIEVKYFEYEIDRPTLEEPMIDTVRETGEEREVFLEDFYEEPSAARDDEQR